MNKLRVLCMLLLILTLVMSTVSFGSAESKSFEGSLEYVSADTGFVEHFDTTLAAAWNDMEPGDDITYTIYYKNTSKKVTRWYMKNEVLRTLEESKDPAENGGYTYVLNNYAPSGDEELFNNAVGGLNENTSVDLEGLEQATDGLKEHFYIAELQPGQVGRVVLHVSFDGETEVNNYMDTNGKLMFQFAVEEQDEKVVYEDVEKHIKKKVTVKTGDTTMSIWALIAVNAAAVALLLVAVFGWRKKRKGGEKA